jgi:signal peptidase II
MSLLQPYSKKNSILLIWWVIVLLWLDLYSKHLFYNLGIYKDLALIEPVMNTGISFSLDLSYRIVVPFSLLALWGFIHLYHKRVLPLMTSLLLAAGTLWNLYDRIVYDGVRDFMVMPGLFVFNIADILLTMGVVLFVWHTYHHKQTL